MCNRFCRSCGVRLDGVGYEGEMDAPTSQYACFGPSYAHRLLGFKTADTPAHLWRRARGFREFMMFVLCMY